MPSNPKSILRKSLPTAHRVLVENIIKSRFPSIKGRVLVIGAGHDPYSHLLTSASEILTTDISDEHGHVDQIVNAHSLPFANSSFDAIISIEVFEHLEDPTKALEESFRVLSSGGVIVASVPFLFRVHGDPFDFQRYTKNGLLFLFSEFKKVDVSEIGGRWAVISDIVTTLSRVVIPLRIFNNIFRLPFFKKLNSLDCPSGYWVEAKK